MKTKSKKRFKLNVMGLFNLETENMNLVTLIIIMLLVMGFVVIVILLLKSYAIPALSIPSIVKGIGSIVKKSRSP